MKAAFRLGTKAYLKEIDRRALASDQVRVRVEACGICGSDLHLSPGEPKEQAIGHEVAGILTELGSTVRGLEVGQRVALDSSSACGRCANCRNSRQDLCTGIQSMFHIGSFGLAEEMIAPAISAIPYDGLPAAVACLQEPLGVAIDMVRLTEIGPTNNVLVIGPGPIGLMAVALAKRQGARRVFVAGRSTRPNRLAVAKQFGADDVFDSLTPRDFGCVIDRIMVTAPPPTIADAIALAGNGAIISFIGLGFGEQANVAFDGNKFHFKKLQLRASFAAPALFGPLALQYLREKVVDGEALVSHRLPLAEMPKAYETARADPAALKVVVLP